MGRFLSGASSAGIKLIRTDSITVTGTYNKPSDVLDDDLVIAELWGGGAGGSLSANNAAGGMPGSWLRARLFAEVLPATMPVNIGAGGAAASSGGTAPGNGGGDTRFLNLICPGGLNTNLTASWRPKISAIFDNYEHAEQAVGDRATPFWPLLSILDAWEFPFLLQSTNSSSSSVLGSGSINHTDAYTVPYRGGWGGQGVQSGGSYEGQKSTRGGSGGKGGDTATPPVNGAIRGGGGGGRANSGNTLTGSTGGRGEVLLRYYRGVPR